MEFPNTYIAYPLLEETRKGIKTHWMTAFNAIPKKEATYKVIHKMTETTHTDTDFLHVNN